MNVIIMTSAMPDLQQMLSKALTNNVLLNQERQVQMCRGGGWEGVGGWSGWRIIHSVFCPPSSTLSNSPGKVMKEKWWALIPSPIKNQLYKPVL